MSGLTQGLVLACALGCALSGGVLFAFSAFVMAGLDRLPASGGIAAMQSINVTAVRPPPIVTLLGTALVCLAAIVVAAVSLDQSWAGWALAGGLTYLLGVVVVTAAANVPLNDRLARVDPSTADAGGEWGRYVTVWTAWNHARSLAGALAAGLLMVALIAG
jgi:uncharacterized membrane protein